MRRAMNHKNGLEEARKARAEAARHLAVTHGEVTVPLRDMHKENHIQPLVNDIIRRRAERYGRT